MNFGNSVAEIPRKVGERMREKGERENVELRQHCCRNSLLKCLSEYCEKKCSEWCPKQTNCGNGIVEIVGFFFFFCGHSHIALLTHTPR